jgi:hypothetical protein
VSSDRLGWWPKDEAEAAAVAERTRKFLARPDIKAQIDASIAMHDAARAERLTAGQPTSVDLEGVLARLEKKGHGR